MKELGNTLLVYFRHWEMLTDLRKELTSFCSSIAWNTRKLCFSATPVLTASFYLFSSLFLLVVRKTHKRQRFMCKKAPEESTFIRIKGDTPPGHTLVGFWRIQCPFILNSRPHVGFFLPPLAEAPGRYSLPELPTPYPSSNLLFYPKVPKFRLVQTPQEPSCNKPATQS